MAYGRCLLYEKLFLCLVCTDVYSLLIDGHDRTPFLLFFAVCSELTTCYDDVAPWAFDLLP